MSFALAANGALTAVSQLNQFQTTFTGGSIAANPTILGSASVVPLVLTMGTGGGNDGIQGSVSGDTGPRYGISYSSGSSGDGRGYLTMSNGAGTDYPNIGAWSSGGGMVIYNNLAVGGSSTINGSLNTGSLTVNGNTTVAASSVALPSGSNYKSIGLASGALALTGDPTYGVGVDDNGSNAVILRCTPTPGNGHAARDMVLYSYDGSNSIWAATARSDLSAAFNIGMNLYTNGFSRVAFVFGTGNGTYSHGLGAQPNFVCGSRDSASTGSCNCYNWFSNTSTFAVNAGTAFVAVAWVY